MSDFILTLFFLLLLLSAYSLLEKNLKIGELEKKRGEDQGEIVRLKEDLRQLEERVATLRQIMDKLPQANDRELERLILVALRDANRLKELEGRNREIEKDRATLAEQVSRLEGEVASLSGASGESCKTKLVAAQRQRDDATGQLVFCSDRLAKVGFGKKPCWVDPTGRIEYIFAVTITEDVIRVVPSWPPQRAEAAQQLPGATALTGTWATGDFAARAAPILAWSEQNDCRHYVTIEDQATSKAAFKRNLLAVEGYFYKLLLGDAEHHSKPAAGPSAEAGNPIAPVSSQPDPSSGM